MMYVGIDVSKRKLDAVLLLDEETLKKRHKQFPNDAEGHERKRSLRVPLFHETSPASTEVQRRSIKRSN